jgi:hypothetical protein
MPEFNEQNIKEEACDTEAIKQRIDKLENTVRSHQVIISKLFEILKKERDKNGQNNQG